MHVITQLDSPIQIHGCYASLVDTDVGNVNYYLQLAVDFKDIDPRTVTAVRFIFGLFDAFNGQLSLLQADQTGTFSDGAEIVDPWRWDSLTHKSPVPMFSEINIWPSIDSVRCAVAEVRFADGTIWQAQAQATPSPSASLLQ